MNALSNLERYLITSNRLFYNSTELINLFGKNALNELYKENKITIHNGLNEKVIRYEK